MSNTIKKLKELRDANPDFASLIEEKFPEIKDTKPFIYVNQLFFRKGHQHNVYQVVRDGSTRLRVRNLTHGKNWGHSIFQSTDHVDTDTYLTKKDFKELLKMSSANLESIKLIENKDINFLYETIDWIV